MGIGLSICGLNHIIDIPAMVFNSLIKLTMEPRVALTTDSEFDPGVPYQQFFSGFFLQKLLVMLDRIDASLTDLANGSNLQEIRQIYHTAINDLQRKRDLLESELNHVVAELAEQADPLMYPSSAELMAVPCDAQADGLKQFIQFGLDQDDTGWQNGDIPDAGILPDDDEHVSRVRDLKTGTWLLFREDGLPPYRACLSTSTVICCWRKHWTSWPPICVRKQRKSSVTGRRRINIAGVEPLLC